MSEAVTNPWGRQKASPLQAVLLALSVDPQTPDAIAHKAGLSVSESRAALQRLTDDCLAIPDNDEYELSGPLSWFGTFEAALKYYARRNFIVADAGDREAHLYLIEVRVKQGRPAGDPLTETLAVFACGKTARNVQPTSQQPVATCEDCRRARELHAR